MARWFKRTKRGSTTYTTYLGSQPTTWSQSYKDGSTRTTYTHRGGKLTITKTTKQGGYTKIEKRVADKKQKQIKYKAWKPKHRVKWGKPVRAKNPRRYKSVSSFSIKWFLYITLFAFSPMIIQALISIL